MAQSGHYFLGADVGGTKTHLLIADETGQVVGFGQAGPGNHEGVGYDGLSRALLQAFEQARPVGFSPASIAGAGFGVGGCDFPSEVPATLQAVGALGLPGPVSVVNDTIIGLLAGSPKGWGVAVVSGTGCNCWGWDPSRTRTGRVTGHGTTMGEGAGASELADKTVQALAHAWSRRGPWTELVPAFLRSTGAKDLDDLIEGLVDERYQIGPASAQLIFDVARNGDPVAQSLIEWAGSELGELVNCVARQIGLEGQPFDVVLVGGMFDGGVTLIEPMTRTIRAVSPDAHFLRLDDPPVIGAVLLGMETAGYPPNDAVRQRLSESLRVVARRQLDKERI